MFSAIDIMFLFTHKSTRSTNVSLTRYQFKGSCERIVNSKDKRWKSINIFVFDMFNKYKVMEVTELT